MWIRIGAIVAMLAVISGAFGAHALKEQLSERNLANFETAARYQMYHAIGLIVVGLCLRANPGCRRLRAAAWAMLGGVVVFSGSLYALALTDQRWWGAITPIGGVLFIVAWGLLAWASRPGSRD